MSRLKIFQPEGCESSAPISIKFSREAAYPSRASRQNVETVNNLLRRARLLFHNNSCPECERSAIEPVDLGDADLNRNNRPVPGTATVVGFQCLSCRYEWSA
jgi:hypothetical protein